MNTKKLLVLDLLAGAAGGVFNSCLGLILAILVVGGLNHPFKFAPDHIPLWVIHIGMALGLVLYVIGILFLMSRGAFNTIVQLILFLAASAVIVAAVWIGLPGPFKPDFEAGGWGWLRVACYLLLVAMLALAEMRIALACIFSIIRREDRRVSPRESILTNLGLVVGPVLSDALELAKGWRSDMIYPAIHLFQTEYPAAVDAARASLHNAEWPEVQAVLEACQLFAAALQDALAGPLPTDARLAEIAARLRGEGEGISIGSIEQTVSQYR